MIDVLNEWNPWWFGKKETLEELAGVERLEYADIVRTVDLRETTAITGARRCGKSTIIYQMIKRLVEKGAGPETILLVNFEDDVLARKNLREIFDIYQSNVNPDTKPYLFLDEVHKCEDWVLFLRKLYDLKKVRQIFITDSSSKFIKSEYARVLTGRGISLAVFPLSFSEYLRWRGTEFSGLSDREEVNKIKNELLDFLRYGGFPEVFFKSAMAKKKLLTEYFSDIIHKDIVERYNVNYAKIKELADFLVSNSANLFSPRKYSRTYGLSLESINTYLQYFADVFLFFFVPKYSHSVMAQQLSSKKAYVCDLGFFNNVGFKFSEDAGRLYENAVFMELKRRGKDIYYWKGEYECDFLVKDGMKIKEAMQVCCKLGVENRQNELGGLMEAIEKFSLKGGVIITQDHEGEEKIKGKTIKFVPLWKWLLTGNTETGPSPAPSRR